MISDKKKLEITKTLIGINHSEEDDLIEVLLLSAKEIILRREYPFRDNYEVTISSKYDMLQCQIAVVLYNKRGAEGEVRHTELNTDRTYEGAGVPESLLSQITPHLEVF